MFNRYNVISVGLFFICADCSENKDNINNQLSESKNQNQNNTSQNNLPNVNTYDDHLELFIEAQDKGSVGTSYRNVLEELKKGEKVGHWIWYIFPQIAGLGSTTTNQTYGIKNLEEAKEYLAHPILGKRLEECTNLVLQHYGKKSANEIFCLSKDKELGLDAIKFRSSMTLFAIASDSPKNIFKECIDKFFDGNIDIKTENKVKNA